MFHCTVWLTAAMLLLSSTASIAAAQSAGLIVRVLDAGPGDATWITSAPGGHTILINCGAASYGHQLAAALQAAGVSQIDTLVITDAHADHIGGCPEILQGFAVRRLLSAGYTDNSGAYRAFSSAVGAIPVLDWSVGQSQAWDDGVSVTVLAPAGQKTSAADDGDSLALEIDYSGSRLVFADGDGQAAATTTSGPVLLLNEGIHTSTATLAGGLLSAVQPQVVTLSYSNLRGVAAPDPAVVTALRALVPADHFYATPEKGTIAIVLSSAAGPTGYAVYTDH
jgi:beta-lactamase superfamily II metal-dependent hydrolase